MLASLIPQMVEIQEGTTDYLSHESALYFLGFLESPPATVTMVSSSRRRPRTIDGHTLTFVFHPRSRHQQTVTLSFDDGKLLVSTLEQTLVDLIGDQHLLSPDADLPGWFAGLPWNLSTLLEIAGRVGETPLRRAIFWALLVGRASWNDIPPDLSRSPVKLLASSTFPECLWESRLRVFFPPAVLRRPALPASPTPVEAPVRDWQELLQYPPFQEWEIRHSRLAIRDDPRPATRTFLEGFYLEETHRCWRRHPDEFLADLFEHRNAGRSEGKHLRLLLAWNAALETIPGVRPGEVLERARGLTESDDPRFLEAGIYHLWRGGCLSEAISALERRGAILFQAGRLTALNLVCAEAVARDVPLPPSVRRLYARSLARGFRFREALALLERPCEKTGDPAKDTRERGEWAYTVGVILQESQALGEAGAKLEEARRSFAEAGDHLGISRALTGLGNLRVAEGRFPEARKSYLQAVRLLRQRDGSDNILAMLLNNLGLVEFKTCRFQQADRLFSKARALGRDQGNPLVEAMALVNQGKAVLALGNTARAFRLFSDAFQRQAHAPGAGFPGETAALIAWTCELQGRHAAARPWWQRLHEVAGEGVPPASQATIATLQAMSGLLTGTVAPGDLFRPLLPTAGGTPGAGRREDAALVCYVRGMIELPKKWDAAQPWFRLARENLVPSSDSVLTLQIDLMEALCSSSTPSSAPSSTASPSVSEDRLARAEILRKLEEARFFDPLWPFWAERLLTVDLQKARPFLKYHLQHTPKVLLENLAARVPGLRAALKRLGRKKGAPASLVLIRNGRPTPLTPEEYAAWKSGRMTACLQFDGPSGELRFSSRRAGLRPGSHAHGILSQLLQAHPAELSLTALYRSVWGGEFDPECDSGALKITLIRLRTILKGLTSAARLQWGKRRRNPGGILLQLDCPWECVL